jgi:hypothetical protein
MTKTYRMAKEILSLRRENRKLRRKLDEHGMSSSDSDSAYERRFYDSADNNRNFKTYFAYVLSSIKRSSPWQIFSSISEYSRKYFLLARICRYAIYIWRIIDTSAAILLFVLVASVVLPLILLSAIIVLFVALVLRRRANRCLCRELGQSVTLFYAGRGQLGSEGFFSGVVKEAAQKGSVIVVSPHFFSPRGMSSNGFYVCARSEGGGVWIVRRHYLYYLMRTLLSDGTRRICVVR